MNLDSLFRWVNRNDNFLVAATGLFGISVTTILKNIGGLDPLTEAIAIITIAIYSLVTTFAVGKNFYSPSFIIKATSIFAPVTCAVVAGVGLIPMISWNTVAGISIMLYSIECWILRPLPIIDIPTFEIVEDELD